MSDSLEGVNQRLSVLERNYVDLLRELSRVRQLIEDKEKLRPVFIESTPTNQMFGQYVNDILDPVVTNTSRSLDVIGFVDNTLMEKLEKCADRVRIICHDEKKNPKEVDAALKRLMLAGAEVRAHPEMHARMILSYNQVLIGSGDLQADSISANRTDACVWSNHPEVIYDTKQFFDKLWNESTPVGNTLLYKSDFSIYNVGAFPPDPWRVNRGNGQIDTVSQSEVGGSWSKKCLKITSTHGSHDSILYRFRDCKEIQLKYKIRHEEFSENGLGSGFHVLQTPKNPTMDKIDETFAIWMGIKNCQLQWHDNNQYHSICDINLKKWYNITLDVNCYEQTFEVMVNTERHEGTFRHYQDNVNTIHSNSWRDQPEWTTYFDQIILNKKS